MKLDLTDRIIMRLEIPSADNGPKDYPDIAVKQLVMTVRPTGSRAWTLRYRFGKGADRKQRRLTLGTWPEMKTEEARELALRARKLLAQDIDPIEWEAEQQRQREAERKAVAERSFAVMAKKFILSQRRNERRSWVNQARALGLRVKPGSADDKPDFTLIEGSLAERWRDKPLVDFERLDISLAVDELIDQDLPAAAQMRLAILKSFFGWAENKGLIPQSPVGNYNPKLPKGKRERVLSDDEIRWLWKAAEAEHYPFKQFILLLLMTGQRRCEVAGIRYVEIAGDVWTLPGSRAKNKRSHTIPLSDLASAVVQSCPRHMSGYAITCGDGPISGFSKLKKRIDARMAEQAGPGVEIRQWGLHDLRRTVATGMASLGIPPHVVEAVENRVSGIFSGVVGTYNRHDYLPEKREALQRWADHVAKIVAGDDMQAIKPEPSNVVALSRA